MNKSASSISRTRAPAADPSAAEVNVCTIEDPIELIDGSFNQMQVQANIDLHVAVAVGWHLQLGKCLAR
jgi:hypothetical protein